MSAARGEPWFTPAARKTVLVAILASLLSILALVACDRDISSARYLRNDVLFRSAGVESGLFVPHLIESAGHTLWIPSNLFVKRSLLSGSLPLWDPSNGGGYSPVRKLQNGVFFPLRWLLALVPDPQVESAFMVFSVCAAFIGTFLLVLRLGLSIAPAVFGAAAFTFSSFFLSMLPVNGGAVYAFLPWLLLAYLEWDARRDRRSFLVLVAAGTGAVTSGQPMYLFWSIASIALAVAGDFALRARNTRALLGGAAALLAGLVLASPVTLPFLAELDTGWAYKLRTPYGLDYLPLTALAWLGHMAGLVTGGSNAFFIDQFDFYGWLGAPVLVLGALGLWRARSKVQLRFLWLLIPIAAVVSIPGPWMSFGTHVPILRSTHPWYLFAAVPFGISIAAAAGFEWAGEKIKPPSLRALALALAIPVLLAWNVVRAYDAFRPVSAVLLPNSRGYQGLVRARQREIFRVSGLWGQTHQPNVAALSGLDDLRISAATLSTRMVAWLTVVDPHVLEKNFPTTLITNEVGSPLIGAFNVKYLIEGKVPFGLLHSAVEGSEPYLRWPAGARTFSVPTLPEVYSDAFVRIVANDVFYRPRAYFAEAVAYVEPGVDPAAAWLRDHPLLLKSAVVVEAEADDPIRTIATGTKSATAAVRYPSNSEVVVETRSSEAGLLVLNDIYEEGWSATVDGRPATIHPVNLISRGVAVEAGPHVVRMRYVPPGFLAGCALSLAALLALLGAARYAWRP
jgi:membrane protein YfhO